MFEAKLIGFKEGIKIAVVWLVFFSCLAQNSKKGLIKPFYAGLIAALFITIILALYPAGIIPRESIGNIIAMSFGLFLMAASAALLHASGIRLFGLLDDTTSAGLRHQVMRRAGEGIVFLVTLLFYLPDFLGSFLYVRELSFMSGAGLITYAYALLGIFLAVLIMSLIIGFFKPYRIGAYFDIPQLLLLLAVVKLLGGGIKGVSEMSLIPSVQAGFMKFVHDVVHQVLVLNMIPDHPLLQATVWNFIGIFFGADLASAASLLILLFFPLMFIYYRLFKPIPEPEATDNVMRRKMKSHVLSDRRKKALPVIFFIGLILIVWFSQRGESISRVYVPEPRPVVASSGLVTIPLAEPTMDLMDGSLHTFSFVYEGEEIRILIMKKTDNTLSVTLDACEICPPEGYGQRTDYLVCLYCQTPLHIDSLGNAGGCNPIPLAAVIDARSVRIEVDEILKKWGFVKGGAGKEGTR